MFCCFVFVVNKEKAEMSHGAVKCQLAAGDKKKTPENQYLNISNCDLKSRQR